MTAELDDLRRRVEHLEDAIIAAAGASDPLLDVRRLRIDTARRRPDLEDAVRDRLVSRTMKRTERSPRYSGINHEEIRRWAAGRCSLPDEAGSMRLIHRGDDRGLIRSGDRIVVDPDDGRMSIERPSEFDLSDLYDYEEVRR